MYHALKTKLKQQYIYWCLIAFTLLTFAAWMVSHRYISQVVADTSDLYQQLLKVSNSALNVQFNMQSLAQLMVELPKLKNDEQTALVSSLVDVHERELLNDFSLISQHFIDKTEHVDRINQAALNWRALRQIILDEHFQKVDASKSAPPTTSNVNNATSLHEQIVKIVDISSEKAENLARNTHVKLANIETLNLAFILMLLATQLIFFSALKKNSAHEKDKALKALNWSNQLLDASPDAMVIADRYGNIKQVNVAAEKTFGYSKAKFITLNISELMPKRFSDHQDRINHFFDQTSVRKMGDGRELFAVNKQGIEFQVEISLNVAKIDKESLAITSIRDVTKQKLIESKVLHQANYDFLTQLPNRFLSLARLSASIERAKRDNKKFAVMYIDLDDFKKANDLYGHQTGDAILVATATKLQATIGSEETVGRIGGDEFFILIDNFATEHELINIANKVLSAFKAPFSIKEKSITLSASIGISIFPDNGETVEDILVNADLSMYHSKDTGKNSFAFFKSSMRDAINRQSAMEEALRGGLQRNEFRLVYQPKYQISSNTIVGFEALLRWQNAEFKNIAPDEFIPLIEQIGLINEIGLFVLDNALKELKKWQSISQRPLKMAVNISPLQFNNPKLLHLILQNLAKYNLLGDALELEITEGVLLEATKDISMTLQRIRKAGISIALDDFGTGYSSLSYIKDYPINSIKIDKSFVDGINRDKTHAALVKAIILLAHSLDFSVTAEGIECDEHLQYLKKHHCDIAQGYYLSHPIEKNEVALLL